jgi:hypothetical protein
MRSSLASHLFGQAAHDQATYGIRHEGAIGLEWYYPPQALGCLAQQGRLVEPDVAEPFAFAEYPLFQKSRIGTHHFAPFLRRIPSRQLLWLRRSRPASPKWVFWLGYQAMLVLPTGGLYRICDPAQAQCKNTRFL